MNSLIAPRLSVMMFLQFFIWGAWYVTAPRALGPLGFAPEDFGWTYSVGPIAGMISPILVGMIADRFFATERVLAVMHLLAAGAMFAAVSLMEAANPSPNAINVAFFVHMLCYFPTLALTNSLAMHNMTDSEKQFPLIRVFGTIGWIVAGVLLSLLNWDNKLMMFQLAAGSGLALGLYSFSLPHTPPPAKGQTFKIGDALGLDALVLLKKPSYLIFMVSSFLVCIPLAFYYQMAERTLVAGGVEDTAFKMTFGQMSEIIFMLLMPLFFKRLGVKWMLFVGILAWVIRYGLFAVGTPNEVAWMLLVGVTLHGICYDFFFVTGQIYTDQVAPKEIRSQAQGMLVLFTLGLGMLIGAQTAGKIEARYTPAETAQLDAQAGEIRSRIEAEGASLSKDESESLETEARSLQRQALAKKNWKNIWSIPAGGAAAILVLFTLMFKDEKREVPDTGAGSSEEYPTGGEPIV
ncbi:MFS transporter [bacterium]|nr:MFS transporter [bacterium]